VGNDAKQMIGTRIRLVPANNFAAQTFGAHHVAGLPGTAGLCENCVWIHGQVVFAVGKAGVSASISPVKLPLFGVPCKSGQEKLFVEPRRRPVR
jgi:hypothetical protein